MLAGTRGKTALLNSVRKRATQLHKTVEVYQSQLANFRRQHPTRHHPPPIEYLESFKMSPDDPFWNDGLFTNNHDPWAVDPDTQHGMRQIAYFDRAKEEMRRIGWEVRRAMRWAISLHDSLLDTFKTDSASLSKLASHPTLRYLPEVQKKKGAMVVIHIRWVSLTRLQEKWNPDFQTVFNKTKTQPDDAELWERWCRQGKDIKIWCESGKLSSIPGHFPTDFSGFEMDNEEGDNILDGFGEKYDDEDDEDDNVDDDDDPEQQWIYSLDQEVVSAVLSEAQHQSQTDEEQWDLGEERVDF